MIKVYDWIVEWLNARHQRVCLHCSFSDWLTVLSGVPQGSVSISHDGLKTGKCYSMLTSVKSCISEEQTSLSYYMNGTKLDKVTEEKDLGVWISNDLKASQQCVQACSKANRILGVLNRTIKCKDDSNLICFYKSLIRPHLKFSTAAWSPHYAKDKLLLEKVQWRFTRMIPRLKNVPYEKRLKELKLWSLEDRRIRADLIEVFKITHGLS